MKIVAIIFLCPLAALLTDATHFCHYKTPMENFEMDRFMGSWWWALETPTMYHQRGDRRPLTKMYKRGNGTIAYELLYIPSGKQRYKTVEGDLWRCGSNRKDGKLVVAMPTRRGSCGQSGISEANKGLELGPAACNGCNPYLGKNMSVKLNIQLQNGLMYHTNVVFSNDAASFLFDPVPGFRDADDGYWQADMWILGTDYNNYAAVYACWFSADGTLRSWSLGWCRQKVCSEEHKNSIKRILQAHEVAVNTLEPLDEGNFPDP